MNNVEVLGETFVFIGEIKNNSANGRGCAYDEYNNIRCEGNFLNNVLNGECIVYYAEKHDDFEISQSIVIQSENETKPKIYYKGMAKNGFPQGKGEIYYENQNIKYRGTFLKGKPHGRFITAFDLDGVQVYQGGMKLGYKFGMGRVYLNGKIHRIGRFRNNQENGLYSTQYYENGMPYFMGSTKNGLHFGYINF